VVSKQQSVAGPGLWLGWIAANAVGYAAGFAVWEAAYPTVRLAVGGLLAGSVNAAGFGLVLGACVGAAQILVLRWPLARSARWIAAVAVGGAVGLAAGAWAGYLLSLAFAAAGAVVYLSDGTEVLLFGLLLGAGMGAGGWLVVRRAGQSAGRWLLASAVGLAIGYAAAIGLLQLGAPTDEPVLGALLGGCAGVIAAIVELLFLGRRPRLGLPAA
jgi:hypothetical protein